MRLLLGVLRLVRAVLEGAGSPRMLGVLWIGTFVTFLLINQQNKSLAEQIFFAGMFMAPVFAWFPAFVLRVILRQLPALPEAGLASPLRGSAAFVELAARRARRLV